MPKDDTQYSIDESNRAYAKLFVENNRNKELVKELDKKNAELTRNVSSLESRLEVKETIAEQRRIQIRQLEVELQRTRPLANETESQIQIAVESEVKKAIYQRDTDWKEAFRQHQFPSLCRLAINLVIKDMAEGEE